MLHLLRHHHEDDHDDHGGLHRDLSATGSAVGRREMLRRFAFGAGALALHGSGDSGTSVRTGTETTSETGGTGTAGTGTCSKIPTETAGPFPGDGSNGANVLNQVGVVRSDIRSSFAGLSGSGYTGSASNASQITLASDNVFSDGSALELATVTGSVAAGFVAALTVAV
jgi:hypothetical protein